MSAEETPKFDDPSGQLGLEQKVSSTTREVTSVKNMYEKELSKVQY